MKFTQIPANTFEEIQMNAGVLLSDFSPETAEMQLANIIGATSGGVSFSDTPQYKDMGEDIDGCPKNMRELKKLESRDIKLSGTFVTINKNQAKSLAAAADIDGDKITPRDDLLAEDFIDLWWVGDYSDKNGENGGFVAIHMKNVLSTGGLKIQATDKEKGKFAFEYTAHYSMAAQNEVPYVIYIKEGA